MAIGGEICNPNNSQEIIDIQKWLFKLLSRGVRVVSSDICDYEIRRSLLLEQSKKSDLESIGKLDESKDLIEFLPVTDEILIVAAKLWADARMLGKPTADDRSLDADLIICATWQLLNLAEPGRYNVIATTNVKHLSRFAIAQKWQDNSASSREVDDFVWNHRDFVVCFSAGNEGIGRSPLFF